MAACQHNSNTRYWLPRMAQKYWLCVNGRWRKNYWHFYGLIGPTKNSCNEIVTISPKWHNDILYCFNAKFEWCSISVHSGDKMSSGGRVVASRYDRSESSWLVAGLAERHISPHLLGHDGPLLGSHFSTIDWPTISSISLEMSETRLVVAVACIPH
jgi:hypothetical protein